MSPASEASNSAAAVLDGPAPQQQEEVLSLPQFLLREGVLSAEQLADAQRTAERDRLALGRVLSRDGLVFSRDFAVLASVHLGLTMVDLRTVSLDPTVLDLLPQHVALRYCALPLQREDDRLTLAMVDPTDVVTLHDLTVRTGLQIDPVIATPEDVAEHIDVAYRLARSQEGREEDRAAEARVTALELRSASPGQVIDLLVKQAIEDRASDVHVEPAEDTLRVRFRIDGILHDVMHLPMEMHAALISRLKIMSGMNIAERRKPQDGQFSWENGDRRVDVRAAVSNTVGGEMAALRLLDKQFTLIGLEQLGMGEDALERFRRLLRLPYGMIVVCGPTGAGKSTTLYASILQMNRMEQKVISLEDPVEYHIPGISQMQVNAEAGVTFATQLRSVLRLDPDVILLGEIRDQETAVIATQAALTGHLVLTSLHANDSVSALLRLRDLGVAPYLIASSIAGVVAQRMVRVVCSSCQTVMPRPVAEQEAYASVTGKRRERFAYGSGCNRCAQTGYRGRSGVYEVLAMSDSLRQMMLADAPRHELWQQALADGTVPLKTEGMGKVDKAITTPYEVMRVLFTLD